MSIVQPAQVTPLIALLPLIIVVVVVIGIIGLVVFGMLLSRRVTLTIKMGGAMALTLASIILLSGLWCMFLSPTMTYSDTRESFYRQVSIGGSTSWSYSFSVQEGETIDGSVDGIITSNASFYISENSTKTFSIYVYDPNNNILWSQTDVTSAHLSIKALYSGVHRIEIRNPNPQSIDCYVYVSVYTKGTFRPLEPAGQWLSLISLPIFGFGIWASGLHTTLRKKA